MKRKPIPIGGFLKKFLHVTLSLPCPAQVPSPSQYAAHRRRRRCRRLALARYPPAEAALRRCRMEREHARLARIVVLEKKSRPRPCKVTRLQARPRRIQGANIHDAC